MTPATRAAGREAPAPRRASRGAPPVPRRVSGPAIARPRVAIPPLAPRRSPAPQPLPRRVLDTAGAFARGLPDHRWLDRLVRGRAWIPVLGVLLAGIVATQVEVLKLGSSMGRWIERTAALSARNQALQASVARLSDDQRIERLAVRMGMVMPAPTAITFLPRPRAGELRTALVRMRPPDPGQFLSTLPAAGTITAQPSGTTSPTVGG